MTVDTFADSIVLDPPGAHHATVIWLHGLGADGHDFAPIPQALQLPAGSGVRFIFPHAPVRAVTVNGNMQMRAWFDISSDDLTMRANMQHLEEISVALDGLIAVQGDVPVVLAGFSQGGSTALYCGLRRSEAVAGIMSIAGWLPPGFTIASPSLPILLLHGVDDEVIPMSRAEASYSVLPDAEFKSYANTGHTLAADAVADIRSWLLSVLRVEA